MIMWPGNVLFIIVVPILLMKKLKPGEVNNYVARSGEPEFKSRSSACQGPLVCLLDHGLLFRSVL